MRFNTACAFLFGSLSLAPFSSVGAQTIPKRTVFINEVAGLYMDGSTTFYGLEIAGPAGTSLDGMQIVGYTSSTLAVPPAVMNITGIIPDEESGFGALELPEFAFPGSDVNSFCLVGTNGAGVQFVSTSFSQPSDNQGPCLNLDGAADLAGLITIGLSRQLQGTGRFLEDFTKPEFLDPNGDWPESTPSLGLINDNQIFVPVSTTVFINEIRYDPAGLPDEELVEIAGPAGTDLTGWQLATYDTNSDQNGVTKDLQGIIPNQQSGFGALFFDVVDINNGPGGVCLLDNSGRVVQFLSVEGTITANDGPCQDEVSVDIGVSEDQSDGDVSLQLRGTGTVYEDFTWFDTPYPQSFGFINAGQNFPSLTSSINSIEAMLTALQASIDGRFDDVDESLDELQESVDSINTTIAEECTSSTGKSTKKSTKSSSRSSSRLGGGKGKGKGRSRTRF